MHFLGGGVQGKCFLLWTFKDEKNLFFRNVRSIYIVKKGEKVKINFLFQHLPENIWHGKVPRATKKIFSIQSAFCSLIALKLKISCEKTAAKSPTSISYACKTTDVNRLQILVLICRYKYDYAKNGLLKCGLVPEISAFKKYKFVRQLANFIEPTVK